MADLPVHPAVAAPARPAGVRARKAGLVSLVLLGNRAGPV
jgi:hypothetical protein